MDSRSALQAFQNTKCHISHKILQFIYKIIPEKRSCTLQWIPAHVNILDNEKSYELAKESRACFQSSNFTTLINASTVASRRLIDNNLKYPIPALNAAQQFTQARLFNISPENSEDFIFSAKGVDVAEAVFDSFGAI
ncbi:hypothetical protein TNCV_3770781 [Trichonephila clavipes]|nr:hypothetical protein TNCV_3770781 [Trichonephila clavipes]